VPQMTSRWPPRGELLYLRWQAVDLAMAEVTFGGSTAVVRGQRVEGTTKGGRSRVISIASRQRNRGCAPGTPPSSGGRTAGRWIGLDRQMAAWSSPPGGVNRSTPTP
jgi:hypothetical protein